MQLLAGVDVHAPLLLPASVGVISDTHGLLRAEALESLRGTDSIIHAGDVGKGLILEQLASVAPVIAVRGNIDQGSWADGLPATATIEAGGGLLHVLHDVHDLELDPRAASLRVVISGHSHRPSIREEDGVLYLNPGSAGPRRFKLPVSVSRLEIGRGGEVAARIMELRL